MTTEIPAEIAEFLHRPTPDEWVRAAIEDLPLILNDHANCEKKAASTAVSLVFRYAADGELCTRMSRLAREELRHYEQVMQLMKRRNVGHLSLSASRYAQGLRSEMRMQEPLRCVDTLIIGAFIEARSCERFAMLAPHLDVELSRFYLGLLAAEARHFRHYLELAKQRAGVSITDRVAEIGKIEGRLATAPDSNLRFHSGPPSVSKRSLRTVAEAT